MSENINSNELTQASQEKGKSTRFGKKSLAVLIAVILILICCGILAIYLYTNSNTKEAKKSLNGENPQAGLTRKEAEDLVEKVGEIVELPENEVPTIATVTNKASLNQKFFDNALEGDKILVYQEAKKVFLFRPSENKIINVAPIIISSPTPVAKPSVSSGEEISTVSPKPTQKTNNPDN